MGVVVTEHTPRRTLSLSEEDLGLVELALLAQAARQTAHPVGRIWVVVTKQTPRQIRRFSEVSLGIRQSAMLAQQSGKALPSVHGFELCCGLIELHFQLDSFAVFKYSSFAGFK